MFHSEISHPVYVNKYIKADIEGFLWISILSKGIKENHALRTRQLKCIYFEWSLNDGLNALAVL